MSLDAKEFLETVAGEKLKCGAPLIFAAGGNIPRKCGKPAKWLLDDGGVRCTKHRRGRGVSLAVTR